MDEIQLRRIWSLENEKQGPYPPRKQPLNYSDSLLQKIGIRRHFVSPLVIIRLSLGSQMGSQICNLEWGKNTYWQKEAALKESETLCAFQK